ncbi:hypothetical protein LEM8419_01755 [Neolewinella maritima]|uniref:Flavohemoglobin expression-modulating QEGLA motif protein n=1 Tax=Neolewinella maritima TaxID=1383882 RepID=A0ABM9B1C3_9BACT|nr:tyrosine/phenylalanine carboxypeptidase domain-containing protein [Neolewinella maritima]CAH1000621.1 hypothetical protein LEM8419_01755 [Neolewinella maritima]
MPDTTTYDTEAALAQLEGGEPLHLSLPGGGELYFARAVPFLTIYRYGGAPGRFALHAEETAYVVLPPGGAAPEFAEYLQAITDFLAERFGGVLLLELWINEDEREPRITVHPPTDPPTAVVESLLGNLGEMGRRTNLPVLAVTQHPEADHVSTFIAANAPQHQDVLSLGIEVNGFFVRDDGQPFPLVLRELRDRLHVALRRTFFDFVRLQTTYNASHFHQLANHRVSDLVWDIDRRLVDISTSFPFLMLVTATNDDEAFEEFTQSGYRTEPTFHYRFLPVDPEALQRDLLNLPIEHVNDATLAFILRDKRDESLRMLDMLAHRGTPNFRYGSMQVFGGVEDDLLDIANRLLALPPAAASGGGQHQADRIGAETFLADCQREFSYLTAQYPTAAPRAVVRDDMSGLMVSQGVMHIGHRLSVPRARVDALLQHEIGTHVLTYWNGRAQPLTLLHSGTPGYEDLQEGLAVLSEWFVGGLTVERMRVLAARVVGIAHMLRGHGFADTFRLLHEHHGLPARSAFYTTARIYRGGGFTKDAVYLRGLVELLDHLRRGGSLEPLFVGKLRLDYVPLLDELRERGILRPPPLIPRYYREDRAAGYPKLRQLQAGMTVFDLLPSA